MPKEMRRSLATYERGVVLRRIIMRNSDAVFIGVGLDTARYGHHVTFLRTDLQFASDPFSFAESREGYGELHKVFESLSRRHGKAHFHIRIDAAGQYATNLIQFLQTLDFPKTISIGEPKRNKDYRSVHFPKRKADPVESHACARFAIVEQPSETPVVSREFLELREVLSALQSQTKRTTRLINQLHNRLSRAFPELATLVKDLQSKWVLKLLQKYPTAEKVAAARLPSIEAIPYLKPAKAKEIHEAAKQSTGSLQGPVVEAIVQQLAREIVESQQYEKNLEQLMEKAFDALPKGNHVHVASIEGVGKLTAAALVANIVSIDRFATPDSLVNYYGTFPEENSSGFDRNGKPVPPGTMRMSQKGNDLVRKLLYMSCLSSLKRNPAIRALYARKRGENKRGDVALGHCMRKMLHLVFAVWRTGKPFDRHHYPWAAATDEENSRPSETREGAEKAAGRKEQSSNRQAVTATNSNLEKTAKPFKPRTSRKTATQTSAINYAIIRQQVRMEEVLERLGHFDCLRGNASQKRGPCPIHKPERTQSRTFSVNLTKDVFQCFDSNCGAHGNTLDLWAAVHQLPIYEAAHHLAETFDIQHHETEQKRRGTRNPKPRKRPGK